MCRQVSHVPGGCVAASTRSFASGVRQDRPEQRVDFRGVAGFNAAHRE